jgi:hypothetical protein
VSATDPLCTQLCSVGRCYFCRPDLSWQTVVVDCLADAGGDRFPAASCQDDRDCPAGKSYGYPVQDGCAAVGECVENNCAGSSCITPAGTCGCDGQYAVPVRAERGAGFLKLLYTSRPYRGIGPCYRPDGGP